MVWLQPLGSLPEGVDYQRVRDKWGSDAMEKIEDVGVIEVDGPVKFGGMITQTPCLASTFSTALH